MRKLILLTSSYPYGNGEEFLQNELVFADKYDKIYICPLSPNSKKITKLIPENAEVILINNPNYSYFNTLLSPAVIAEIAKNIFNPKLAHEFLFFYKKAYAKYKVLSNALPDLSNDDITLYSYWLNETSLVAVLLKRQMKENTTAISRAHGYDLYEYRSNLNCLPFRRYLLENLDNIFPCSQDGTDYLCTKYPQYKSKISTAYLGTADNGKQFGKRDGVFHLVSCSYMVSVKRIELILNALKLLDFNVKWTHIGDGVLAEDIKSQACELPNNISCEFKGHLSNSGVIDFYSKNNISLFINVSASEGLPVTIMEALSFGIPVIATNVGGSKEAVNTHTGILLDKNTLPDKIAAAIQTVHDMGCDDYNLLCQNSRIHWCANFNSVQNYSKFYKNIV